MAKIEKIEIDVVKVDKAIHNLKFTLTQLKDNIDDLVEAMFGGEDK